MCLLLHSKIIPSFVTPYRKSLIKFTATNRKSIAFCIYSKMSLSVRNQPLWFFLTSLKVKLFPSFANLTPSSSFISLLAVVLSCFDLAEDLLKTRFPLVTAGLRVMIRNGNSVAGITPGKPFPRRILLT